MTNKSVGISGGAGINVTVVLNVVTNDISSTTLATIDGSDVDGSSVTVQALSAKEIEANFDLKHHFKHVDTIFKRVFGKA